MTLRSLTALNLIAALFNLVVAEINLTLYGLHGGWVSLTSAIFSFSACCFGIYVDLRRPKLTRAGEP